MLGSYEELMQYAPYRDKNMENIIDRWKKKQKMK